MNRAAVSLVVAGLGLGGTVQAAPVSWTASGTPAGLAATATATFSLSGSSLTIDLAASGGGAGDYGPGSALTGLFFDLGTNNLSLNPASATIPTGSSIVNASSCNPGPCGGVTNVSGEWGYQNSPGGFGGGAPSSSYGIASSGYLATLLPMDIGNFNGGAAGTNLDNPASLDGANLGLLPTGVSLNGGLASTPVIETTAEFVLTGLPAGFALSDIANVSFQYGTAFSDANLPGSPGTGGNQNGAPEPATIALLGVGLLGLGYVRHRRR
ncbi:MAG TPA: XDD4 family exosortase-dependent surface protein [Acetobacteraceae bacterium]|nr:XDD4 family exosortase-dependent surface protein [Acetobacteraceae bacterium]